MRNLFSWRLRPSEADFSKLWENATFVFDTNFLLDLYRVSRLTVEDFLKILEHLLSIFDSKVGDSYDEQTLQILYKEADNRYKKSQPPGFSDGKDKGR